MRERINILVKTLNEANEAYYNRHNSIMSDYEYDAMLEELRMLEMLHPYLLRSDSPTQTVGASCEGRCVHSKKMLSINNVYSEDEVLLWLKKKIKQANSDIRFMAEWKFDGISVSLHYVNGVLASASTRGDGFIGVDITENIKRLKGLPLHVNSKDFPDNFELWGELVLPKSRLETINQKLSKRGEKKFSNERNAISCMAVSDTPDEFSERGAELYIFQVTPNTYNDSNWATLSWLESLGFQTALSDGMLRTPEDVFDYIEDFDNLRDCRDFCADGVVFKVDSEQLRDDNKNSERAYDWCLAYKFRPKEAVTTVNYVFFDTGRTGNISCVAQVKPVKIGNETITRVNLNSSGRMEDLNLSAGDSVLIRLSGDCIPYIEKFVTRSGRESFSVQKCPHCGRKLVKEKGVLVCPNFDCFERTSKRILHFAKTIGIKGLKKSHTDAMTEMGLNWIDTVFRLNSDSLMEYGMTRNTAKSIEEQAHLLKRTASKERLLSAFGVPGIDSGKAKKLIRKSIDLKRLSEIAIQGIDEVISHTGTEKNSAERICRFFKEKTVKESLEYLI